MRLNELIGIEFPFIQGGMANIATAEFAAAVSNAGALGLIGAGGMSPEVFQDSIRRCRTLTEKPFGVNIMLMHPQVEQLAAIAAQEKVAVVTTGAGDPARFIPAWKESGAKVFPVIPAVALAKVVARAGADGDDRKAMRLFEQLDRKINEQRLFLNPGLSREDLMRLINISKNQIAQVIQAGAGTNLAGYLNGLRMEYAARLLIRYPEYTVNAIAQEAGIPNLSSFHRLFKNRYGMTPSEFRKAQCG